MFEFLKQRRSILDSLVLNGFTDLHTHLLPGVDDGMKSGSETEEALAFFAGQGVKHIFFTPHIMEGYPENNRSSLEAVFNGFMKQYDGALSISLAAEYMLDNAFEKHLGDGLLTLKDNYVLVETSYMNPPIHLEDILYSILSEGYKIILAHPERYLYMSGDHYDDLLNRGVFFQLNLLSLVGAYGKKVKERALSLLSRNQYTFVGTDIHRLSYHLDRFAIKGFTKKQLLQLQELKENNDGMSIFSS